MASSPFDNDSDIPADSALDMDLGGDMSLDMPVESTENAEQAPGDMFAGVPDKAPAGGPAEADAPEEVPVKRTPSDVYSWLLAAAFICLCTGVLLLYMELRDYGSYPYWKTSGSAAVGASGR
ncbi:hypothetical protein [Lignipirellula cremea]|uniref:Uncharacterized protein n=1 Tax=Lignipirellula cremea TaxID=2528010 RepID=A0A518DQX5_9BACT|nr:hypothetical protein [Lignipirellula cremea]QDU94224.1 hypothetical protein Pla8534_20120 [Lignipirellula cremea]